MTRRRLISRTELSRLAGVSQTAVTKAANHGSLRASRVGDRLDLDHPEVAVYLKRHKVKVPAVAHLHDDGQNPTAGAPGGPPIPVPTAQKRRRGKPGPAPESGGDAAAAVRAQGFLSTSLDVSAYLDMPLRRIAEEYWEMREFKDLIEARKTLELIREKTIGNEQREGTLVSRELVDAHIFGAFEKLFRRLLGSLPKTLARRMYGAAKGGTPLEESERVASDLISSELRPSRNEAARILRKL